MGEEPGVSLGSKLTLPARWWSLVENRRDSNASLSFRFEKSDDSWPRKSHLVAYFFF